MNLFCGHGDDLKKNWSRSVLPFWLLQDTYKTKHKIVHRHSTQHACILLNFSSAKFMLQTKIQTKKKQQQTGKPWRQKFTDGFQTPPPFLFLKGSNFIFTMCLSRFVHYLIFFVKVLISFIYFIFQLKV